MRIHFKFWINFFSGDCEKVESLFTSFAKKIKKFTAKKDANVKRDSFCYLLFLSNLLERKKLKLFSSLGAGNCSKAGTKKLPNVNFLKAPKKLNTFVWYSILFISIFDLPPPPKNGFMDLTQTAEIVANWLFTPKFVTYLIYFLKTWLN